MNDDGLSSPRLLRGAAVLALAASLSACATTGASNPKDPFEKFNRAMFSFNDTVDQVALKPAATAYRNVLPGFVQTGVSNFFGNLADVWTTANDFLQGKGATGMSDMSRVVINSTFGVVGLIDVASDIGLQKHNEDFGQTLGTWGVGPGPYLMLPLLGPSTVRDTAALTLDIKADPWAYKDPVRWRNVGIAVRAVDQRAALLDASNLMEEAALDRYEFVRDGFLQRRESRIDDGDGDGPSRGKKNDGDAPAAKPDADAAPAKDAGAPAPAKDATPSAPAKDATAPAPAKDSAPPAPATDTAAAPAKDSATPVPAKDEAAPLKKENDAPAPQKGGDQA